MNQREQVAVSTAHKISTRRHIPEDGILHSHRCENLKSHIKFQMRKRRIKLLNSKYIIVYRIKINKGTKVL
jgi:hypothetical protein